MRQRKKQTRWKPRPLPKWPKLIWPETTAWPPGAGDPADGDRPFWTDRDLAEMSKT